MNTNDYFDYFNYWNLGRSSTSTGIISSNTATIKFNESPWVMPILNKFGEHAVECEIEHIYADVDKGILVIKWHDNMITKVALGKDNNNWDLEAGVNAAIVKRLYKSRNHFLKFIEGNTTYIQPKKAKNKKKTK